LHCKTCIFAEKRLFYNEFRTGAGGNGVYIIVLKFAIIRNV
jgi:hypothetical protein